MNTQFSQVMQRPILVRLRHNLIALSFQLMKAIAAARVVEALLRRNPGIEHIVETSSGTAALGLAWICQERGLRLTIASDPAIDPNLQHQLEALGANVQLADPKEKYAEGGFQAARLHMVEETLRKDPKAYWTHQYDNDAWSLAYREISATVFEQMGYVDRLVAPFGSGASGCGIASGLRIANPKLELYAVDTPGSVLFGCKEGPRDLRGLGNSLIPGNLDHTAVDGVYWTTNPEAASAAYYINSQLAGDVGYTSGAAWLAARHLAYEDSAKRVVFVCPDNARRYPELYDRQELCRRSAWLDSLPIEPKVVTHPSEVCDRFSYYAWNRQELSTVAPETTLFTP